MMRLSIACTTSLLLLASAHAQSLPAFPGAEGFGSIATGGRGGDVYYVTNLNASGAGSFAFGVQNAPASGRTILFAVSGHIRLPSGSGGGLTISRNKITVAGQTAPGDGICFWNNTMNMTGNDLVFRNIRWRYGKQAAGGDSVDINGSQRIIFDHCDVMFSTDENMSSFGSAPEHLTFQWSTNAWGLQSHSCGGLWKMRHATVHHSLWANNHTRNPKLIGCDVFDWVNNLTFGWDLGFNLSPEVTGGNGYTYRVNIRNSTFSHGGSTTTCIYGGGLNDDGSTKFKLHMSDTALDGNNNGILDVSRTNYAMVSATGYSQVPTAWPQTTNGDTANPVLGTPVTVTPRMTGYKKILSQTGATRLEIGSRPLRDEITQLCVTRAANLQRGIISDPLELNLSTGTAFAALQSATAPIDSDLDGMPDEWEDAVGYNKTVASHNNTLNASETASSFFPPGTPAGYTHLEEYLHFKAVPHGTVAMNTTNSPSFVEVDLRKYTSGFTANPTFTLSDISNGITTQSGPGNAVVRFTPTSNFSGRAGFFFTVTDSAGDSWTQQCCLLVSTQPLPRPITWVGDDISNTWNSSTPNFTALSGPTAFADGDSVSINDSGSNNPTLKVVGTLAPSNLTVSNSAKNFTLEGSGSLTGTGGIQKSGTGTLTLRVPNSGSGPSSLNGGAIILGGPNLNSGTLPSGTLTLSNNATLTNVWPLTSSTQNITAPLFIPEGESATIQTGRRIQLSGTLTGNGNLTIQHQGTDGTVQLRGAMNNFSGNLNFAYSGSNPAITAIFNGASFNGWSNASINLPSPLAVACTTNSTGNTFGIGELSGSGTLGGGSAGAPLYQIGGLNSDSSFSGVFSGNARINKIGSGALTLTGSSTHSGTTTVSSGILTLNGTFSNSPVTIASGATLAGTGTLNAGTTASPGAFISPGANRDTSSGTLTTSALTLSNPFLAFDLSNNPLTGNDRIQVSNSGAITLTGTQNFTFNLTQGNLGPGTYNLITTDGTLTATSAALSSNLPTGTRQTLSLEQSPSGSSPGFVRLVVSGTNANLTWTGANGALWNQQTTSSWTGASPATFFNLDEVTFNDSASTGTVAITQPVAPRSITVNNSTARAYSFSGAPITGLTSLVKSGNGTLTLNLPQFTLTNSSTTLNSTTVTVSSSANLLPGMTVTGSGIPAGTVISSIPSATTITISQPATASATTTSLTFESRNTYSGGTFLNGGTIILTSNATQTSGTTYAPANSFGIGSGPVTFNGGTLTLHGHTGSTGYLDVLYGPFPNDLIVPAGQSGTLNLTTRGFNAVPFQALTGSLTGSGTLNLTPNYFRASITGDWSAFSGTLNVRRPTSGASDPRFQLASTTGLPLATVNLEQVRMEYTAVPPTDGAVIPIGSLSGISTSVISGAQNATSPIIWRVGSLNTSTTFAGNFTPFSGGGPIGIAKVGTGTWTLTGTGTINAGITVENGTLSYADASTDTLSGTSEISVNSTATLQINNNARIIGASCEIFPGGTLTGAGTLQAPTTSSGTIEVSGNLNLIGDASLTGTIRFPSFSSRLNITGDLFLDSLLAIPNTSLTLGRKPLITFTGDLTLGDVTFPPLPSGFLPILDTTSQGEVAVILVDQVAYQTWQLTHFGSTSTPNSQPTADPDNDGMTNLEEFEAGTNPNDPLSALPLVWLGGGSNVWDLATSPGWLENTTPRVFRNNRQVSITDTGSNSPSIDLRGSLRPASLTVSNSSKAFSLTGSGSIEGPTGLSKSGSNTLTLATANAFTGPTTINAGVLTLQNPTALGSSSATATVALNARLELQNNITVSGKPLILSGQGGTAFFNGALNSRSGTNTWTGPITLASSNSRIGAQASATLIVSGPISSAPDTSGLTIRSADTTATVILSGTNNYLGETNVVGGTLRLGASNSLPTTTTLRLGLSNVAGRLDLNGFSQEIAGITPISGATNEITSATPATLTVNTTADASSQAPLTGSLSLAKTGPATLTLTAPSSYTGSTIVTQGTLAIDLAALSSPNDLLNPVSPLTLAGTLEVRGKASSPSSQTFAGITVPPAASATITLTPNNSPATNLTLGNTWSIGAGASLLIDLSAPGTTLTSSPALTGGFLPGVQVRDAIATGPATVVDGRIVRYIPPTLTASSNDPSREFSSRSSTYSNGSLTWTDSGNLTNRSVHRLILDSTISGGTIDLGPASNILTLTSGEITFLGQNPVTITGGQLGASSAPLIVNTSGTSTLTLASTLSGGAGSVTLNGTASIILGSPNTFTGGLTLNGPSASQSVANALGSANGNLTLINASLDLNGIATGIGSLAGSNSTLTNSNPTSATLTLGNNNATGTTFAGSITGNIALSKTGSGTQTLAATNSFTGNTTVTAGTLLTAAPNALGQGNLLVRGGTVDLQSFSSSHTGVQLTSGTITSSTGTLTAPSFELVTGTLAARISGSSATVAKSSSPYTNTATLSGQNSYGGATTLAANSGSLILAHDAALGNSPSVEIAGSGTAIVLNNGITISGKPITLRGTGANNNTLGSFSGALTTATSATATWTGSVTLGDSNGRLGAGNNGTLIVSGPILGSGANQSLSISSGSASSLGTTILSSPASFTGNTSIVRGTLRLGTANALPATTILDVGSASITDNATFDLAGFPQTLAGLRRSSTNTSQVSTVTNSSSTPSTLTLNQSTALTYSGRITGNITLSKSGAGILTLSNSSALAPSVSVSIDGGSLSLSSSHTITALRINGVWQNPGTYSASNTSNRISGTGSLVVTTSGPSGFSSWITTFPNLADPSPTADPDADGINNLLEFIFNGNPTQSNTSILPSPTLTATHFVFTFTQREDSSTATTQTFEYGSTMDTWTSVNITAPTGPEVSFSPTSSGTRTVTVSIPRSSATNGRLFGRIKVTQP